LAVPEHRCKSAESEAPIDRRSYATPVEVWC
jgi:hypothetical protein